MFDQSVLCSVCCQNIATEKHHKLSQIKANKRLYGELIHHPLNLVDICEECHKWKPIPKWSEEEFCAALGIEPRSKAYQLKKLREGILSI